MAKSHITRTFGPIHFEDLEPHRFEDLTRQLIYDLKDWQNIEATGRSGSDDGFDVRAYEREPVAFPLEEVEDIEEPRFAGRLWMIQCKREAGLGPGRVAKIIKENVRPEYIPYGYILVASTNFSKRSYDVFRAELRALGVTEFYLWGKAELEDMLFMPKYDRLLFTFFGVSVVSKRRSLTSEVRSTIAIKNKLLRIWGGQFHDLRNDVLIRLINDEDYPFIGEKFSSFNHPKWFVAQAKGFFTKGIVVKIHEYFAYIDVEEKQWDYTTAVDTFAKPHDRATIDELATYSDNCQKLEEYCSYMRAANQAKVSVLGLLRFDSIHLIDEKGDLLHPYPHLFSEQKYEFGVFSKLIYRIKRGDERFDVEEDGFERVVHFPKRISTVALGPAPLLAIPMLCEVIESS